MFADAVVVKIIEETGPRLAELKQAFAFAKFNVQAWGWLFPLERTTTTNHIHLPSVSVCQPLWLIIDTGVFGKSMKCGRMMATTKDF